MDNLEKFIKEHSSEWDDKKAPESAWSKIESQLNDSTYNKKGNRQRYYIGIALAFVGLAIATYIFTSTYQGDMQKAGLEEKAEPLQFAEIESFEETEQYFESAIYASYKELTDAHYDPDLENDLADLDRAEKKLREEYKNAQGEYKEFVLRALIDNHQTKLTLLQSILNQIYNTDKYAKNVL